MLVYEPKLCYTTPLQESSITDSKALKILFDTYWSNTGWKQEIKVSPENFDYARNAGIIFQSINLSHDEVGGADDINQGALKYYFPELVKSG